MTIRSLKFSSFSIDIAEGWDDITVTLDGSTSPLTLADPVSGVGALQLSAAIYRQGAFPHVTIEDIMELLGEFAEDRKLVSPFDRQIYSAEISLLGQSFRQGDDFVRVWYASDGKSILLITYVCDWSQKDTEAAITEMMVRSIRFNEALSV